MHLKRRGHIHARTRRRAARRVDPVHLLDTAEIINRLDVAIRRLRLQLQPGHRLAPIGALVGHVAGVGGGRGDVGDFLVESDAVVCALGVEVEGRGGEVAEEVVPAEDALGGEEPLAG